MTTPDFRRKIKKAIDQVPTNRLVSLADFVAFLNRPPLTNRLKAAQKAISTGKGVNWRAVRTDV